MREWGPWSDGAGLDGGQGPARDPSCRSIVRQVPSGCPEGGRLGPGRRRGPGRGTMRGSAGSAGGQRDGAKLGALARLKRKAWLWSLDQQRLARGTESRGQAQAGPPQAADGPRKLQGPRERPMETTRGWSRGLAPELTGVLKGSPDPGKSRRWQTGGPRGGTQPGCPPHTHCPAQLRKKSVLHPNLGGRAHAPPHHPRAAGLRKGVGHDPDVNWALDRDHGHPHCPEGRPRQGGEDAGWPSLAPRPPDGRPSPASSHTHPTPPPPPEVLLQP